MENLQTYPVYFPGREPEGYWEMLQHVGPKPLIEPEHLKTESDWIEAGRRVFDEANDLHLRTLNPSDNPPEWESDPLDRITILSNQMLCFAEVCEN